VTTASAAVRVAESQRRARVFLIALDGCLQAGRVRSLAAGMYATWCELNSFKNYSLRLFPCGPKIKGKESILIGAWETLSDFRVPVPDFLRILWAVCGRF